MSLSIFLEIEERSSKEIFQIGSLYTQTRTSGSTSTLLHAARAESSRWLTNYRLGREILQFLCELRKSYEYSLAYLLGGFDEALAYNGGGLVPGLFHAE
jgi:hypothetical protein